MRRSLKEIFLLILCLVMPSLLLQAAKDQKAAGPLPPPMAVSQVAATAIGEPVTIVLVASGRVVEPITFQIRHSPQLGTLGEIRNLGGGRASVLYTPRSKTDPGSDSFSFAVQSFDSAVSAPGKVAVNIFEAKPMLEFPKLLEFGKVFIGDSAMRELAVSNSGGGTLAGVVEVAPPWSVSGDGRYSLGHGQKAVFSIRFAPSDEQSYVSCVRVGREQSQIVSVSGEGIPPIVCSPGSVSLKNPSTAETFSVTFTNQSPEPKKIHVDWPGFVRAPAEFEVAAHGSVRADAEVNPAILTGFHGKVGFSAGNFSDSFTLDKAAAPAKLAAVGNGQINFGLVKSGRSAHSQFTVKNVGGSDARLKVTATRELLVTPDAGSVILIPGGEQVFDVHLEMLQGDLFSGQIQITADSGSSVSMDVCATFPPVPGTADVASISPPSSAAASGPLPPPPVVSNLSTLPVVKEIWPVLTTPHEIEIAWTKLPPEVAGYWVQRRVLVSANGKSVRSDWAPWPEAKIQTVGNEIHARFQHLAANYCWVIRVVGLDSTGAPKSYSGAVMMATRPLPSWDWIYWVVGAVAFFVLVRSVIQRRQAQFEEDSIRIDRIGK